MKKITDQEIASLIQEYRAGYSKPLNYEKYDYDEMNHMRWARERFERLAKKLAYYMAIELLERRMHEIQDVSKT